MHESVDTIVIGAGVIGLAVARALGKAGREALILEKNQTFGAETSSRNSEVIHAGIQYKPGSNRGRFIVSGRDALYAFCQERGVAHKRCGKLLVACDESEIAYLYDLKRLGEQNGVDDLEIVDASAAASMEPGLKCEAALVSPSSGIVDSHALMQALLGEVEALGGVLACRAPVVGGKIVDDGVMLQVGGDAPMALSAKLVVNSAGLSAQMVAQVIKGIPATSIPRAYFARGIYFSYQGKAPFSRLIYPVPRPDSVGIHYTRDLGGQGKLGPDIEFIDNNHDYNVDEKRKTYFVDAVQKFWPDIEPARLVPGYAGIRPKAAGPGEEGDYIFSSPADHGARGYIGLYGIESPGLTSCLAIADHVCRLAQEP